MPMPYPELDKRAGDPIYPQSKLSDEEVFADKFNELGGKFIYCDNQTDLLQKIHVLYENRGWTKMLCAEEALMKSLNVPNLEIALSANDNPEDADACITACDALVARTGSIIITSRLHMGRTSSVFYPVHIVVAYTGQVVHDIQDAVNMMKKKYGNDMPSMINLNTGPSRTADIEKTLVVGVHGPGEVFCFLVNDI